MKDLNLLDILDQEQKKALGKIVFEGLKEALSQLDWKSLVKESLTPEGVRKYILEPEMEELPYSLVDSEELSRWLSDLFKKALLTGLTKGLQEQNQ